MRRIDKALQSVGNNHRQESYVGPLASTSSGGKDANVNNLYNSQVRAKAIMPYGISSRSRGGLKAQTIVNDNSDSMMIGVYDPYRPNVDVGEICLYSIGGCKVYLKSNGEISITSGDNIIEIDDDNISITSTKNVDINCENLLINGKSVNDIVGDIIEDLNIDKKINDAVSKAIDELNN